MAQQENRRLNLELQEAKDRQEEQRAQAQRLKDKVAQMKDTLGQVQQQMQTLNNDSTPEQNQAAAAYFAQAIFGPDQAERIMAFYHDDAGCVINICGQYFSSRLSKKITKAQKKQRAVK